MKNWQRISISVAGFLMLVGAIGGILAWNLNKNVSSAETKRGSFARIDINLAGTTIDEVDVNGKETKYYGNKVVVYDGGENEYSEVTLKGRGNGTWGQAKNPYQLRFTDKVNLFGMGKTRKWYLLANYLDGSNLRNDTAFYLGRMLGMEYGFEGKYVELYVDGEYRGLYYLTHAMEISKEVVDLHDPLGVLVELDNLYGRAEKYYQTGNGDLLVVKDAVMDSNVEEAMGEFVKDFNALEVAILQQDYDRIRGLADTESLAQYYLLSELTVNPDAYWTSFYFYKDGSGDKIHAGPGWDFDLALGGAWGNWLGLVVRSATADMPRRMEVFPEEYEGLEVPEGYDATSTQLSEMMFRLIKMPEFRIEVERIYQRQIMGREDEILNYVRRQAVEIYRAALRDNERWGRDNYADEVVSLLRWLERRLQYFEENYGGNTENSVENNILDVSSSI